MIPKRVTLEDFLSYGPKTEIAFTADEPLWVVGGPNGAGKSAVFDAMTYCLYAEHRGGGRGHDQLVRHGADKFSVSFEFEFNGTDYRVTRTRTLRGRTTQAVERQAGGCWERVKDVDGADAVTEWVRSTLGLPFDAFCASVLLRQGRSDDILDAAPAKRLETLKKIIGVERYEELSGRVNTARKDKDLVFKQRQTERTNLKEVTEQEMTAATAEVERTATAREGADIARQRAVAAVPQAEQWVKLGGQLADLDHKLVEAEKREREAESIRRDHARFAELSRVVGDLQKLIPLRLKVADAEKKHSEATTSRDALRAEFEDDRQRAEGLRLTVSQRRQEASDLSTEMMTTTHERDRHANAFTVANELATVRHDADSFPATLDSDLVVASKALRAATDEERAARDAQVETTGRLNDARKQEEAFADVKAGVTCSQCGQVVTEKHAAAERWRLGERVTELTAVANEAKRVAGGAIAARTTADARLKELADTTTERDRLRERQAGLEKSLATFGGAADPAAVQREIERLAARLTELQTGRDAARVRQQEAESELKKLEPMLSRQEANLKNAETHLTKLGNDLVRDTATHDALLVRLPEAWRDATDADTPAVELKALTASGIEQRFQALEKDADVRRVWEGLREKVVQDMAAVPTDAQIPVDTAKANQRQADTAFRTVDAAHRTAVAIHDDLTRRRDQLTKLTADIATAEADARVHTKLDKLLGKEKLQRELIREAEFAIVQLAQQTLANLSGGDLSVALAEADGDDKAFDLLVCRGDDPNPIGVKMLSGSQKFRVAMSVALAVGRFATGQTRPLECVIIDEGFGSLDKDGLRAAADELNRLKDHLRRIIVVSHQEEFTDHFPVVIHLSHGENGTTAEAVRRQR